MMVFGRDYDQATGVKMKTQRPLKILTLDGGGLQALATLSIVNSICKAIGKRDGKARPPAPYEVFDIIGGVGVGGWIALLLGKYHLDVATCTAMYMEIVTKVDVETSDQHTHKRDRAFKLDQTRLMAVVEETFHRYGLDQTLIGRGGDLKRSKDPESGCQHAFAVGIAQGQAKQQATYQMFRSYKISEDAKDGRLPGHDFGRYRVPEIFAATAAAKFFLKPCKIEKFVFFDDSFLGPHPVSSLALDEALALYGAEAEISIILNVGPGIPADRDLYELDIRSLSSMSRLSRKLTWPIGKSQSLKMRSWFVGEGRPDTKESEDQLITPSEWALRQEIQRRTHIRGRLEALYGNAGKEKYLHLGPDHSMERASLNDVHTMRAAQFQSGELRKKRLAEAEKVVRQYWVESRAEAPVEREHRKETPRMDVPDLPS